MRNVNVPLKTLSSICDSRAAHDFGPGLFDPAVLILVKGERRAMKSTRTTSVLWQRVPFLSFPSDINRRVESLIPLVPLALFEKEEEKRTERVEIKVYWGGRIVIARLLLPVNCSRSVLLN